MKKLKITKRISFIKASIIISVFFSLIGCSIDKNDLTKENLKGKVKSVSRSGYAAEERFGNIEKGESVRTTFEYDYLNKYNEYGNIIEENTYGFVGNLEKREIYEYNDHGNKIEKSNYDSIGNLTTKDTYKYSERGNQIEKSFYLYGDLYSKETFKYDEYGNQIEKIYDNFSGGPSYKYIYKYDEHRNIIEENNYDSDGELSSHQTFEYKFDESGNQIEINTSSRSSSGSTSGSKETFKYDEYGNQIENIHYNYMDVVLYKYTCKYDEHGNIIEENHFNERGVTNKKYEYKYEYDERYNWIKVVKYHNAVPYILFEREIEYFI